MRKAERVCVCMCQNELRLKCFTFVAIIVLSKTGRSTAYYSILSHRLLTRRHIIIIAERKHSSLEQDAFFKLFFFSLRLSFSIASFSPLFFTLWVV